MYVGEFGITIIMTCAAVLAALGLISFIRFGRGEMPGGGHQVHRSAFAESSTKRSKLHTFWMKYTVPIIGILGATIFLESMRTTDPAGFAGEGIGWLYAFFGALLLFGFWQIIIRGK